MSDSKAADVFEVVVVPRGVGERTPITGREVEDVWSAVLGPTATMVARRLGHYVDTHPTGGRLDLAALASGLGVPPSKVRAAVGRLDRFSIVALSMRDRRIALSGWAPVPPARDRRGPADDLKAPAASMSTRPQRREELARRSGFWRAL